MTTSHTFASASFHTLVDKVTTRQTAPFALQIGAMDGIRFDLLHPHLIKGGWSGLLVEPVEDMFHLLQKNYSNHPAIKLVNCAIGDHDGTLTLRRIDPYAVSQGYIPEEALGITTSLHEGGMLNDPRLWKAFPKLTRDHVIEFTIPCLTLKTLLTNYAVTTIDLVMIDTEGADWLIARQLDLTHYSPQLICLEHSSLLESDKSACVKHFIDKGYMCALCEEDHENVLFFKNS